MQKLVKVQYICKKLGINQKDLAGLIGCSESNFSSKVNGRTQTTLSEMQMIKEELNKLARKKSMKEYTLDEIFTD